MLQYRTQYDLESPVNLRSRALASGAFFRVGQALSYILVAKSSM